MNLLIFPEYAYPANHVVVNTVYEDLLPSRGHVVHMIRPKAGVTHPQFIEASWAGGSMVVFPENAVAGPVANALALIRRWRWLLQAVRKFEGVPLDVVLVRNDLPSALVGMRMAKRRGIPFIYQLSSPDAEFRVKEGRRIGGLAGGYQRLRGWLDLVVRGRVMRGASAVLAISDAMAEYVVARDSLDARRVFSFPMGVQASAPQPTMDIDALRGQLGLEGRRAIVYSGVLDPMRESIWMLDVLDKVRGELPDAVLLVLTYQRSDDARRRAFEEEARRRGAAVTVVGPLSHREVQAYLRCADVMVSPLPPTLEFNICSPTKSLEGMCAGLPVVGSVQVAEHAKIFKQSGGGIAVPWDQGAFAEAIISLLGDPDMSRAMGARGRSWVLKFRTYSRLTEYLEHIISEAGSVEALARLPHQPEQDSVA